MDENASRAVFLGVSVFVAVITLTVILNFYRTAKDTAAVANRFDITNTGNKRANEILSKKQITGLELRYLLNYYYNDSSVRIIVFQTGEKFEDGEIVDTNIDSQYYGNYLTNEHRENFWSEETQRHLDEMIRPNYNYGLAVDTRKGDYTVVATFEN